MKKLHTEEMDRLFESVLSLKNVEECYDFFEDICTVKELKDISMRLKVAELLKEGHSYNAIEEETGVSQATISRVKKSLEYGTGGYEMIIDRMEKARKR